MVKAPKSNPSSALREEDQIKLTYAFFDAQKEKVTGNQQRAAELFASCLRIDPKNAAAMYELASIYNEARKYGDALFFARSAAEADPANPWYQLLLADTYEKSGKYAEAIQIYQKLYKQHPSNIEYLFSEADAWLMQGKATEAIRVYDEIEKQMGPSREMTQQKQRLYLKMGKVNEAANELEKLILTDPSNMEYYSLLVELWQVNNQPEKAMETIRRMQAIDPDHPSVALALAEQYRSEGKKAESFQQLKKAFESPQLPSEVKIRILTSYLPLVMQNEEMMQQSLELSELCSKAHPAEANPQTVYGDFLAIAKKYEQARVQYRAGLAIDKKNMQAWQQLLIINSELRDWNAMDTEGEEAVGLFPDQSIFYLFSGIAKIQNKKYEDAARTLLSGSKLVVDNDQQQLEFYSNLGDVYDKLKKFEDSDKYYQKALNIDPANDNVLNNWAYYLSLRREQLEKAAEMSKRSNELRPNTSSYLDTYGWILFVQGKYSDALEWLDKAMKAGGDQSGTIIEHYGDALFKLGRTVEALEYWERAKKAGEHSDLLEKKLNDKKWYE
jgi:tetratricopeptide (TPR) repeat protein